MGVIYQLTFFLALAILAIVITIFVFAVSLLGRAMEAAATSEREKLTERKESNVKEMQAMNKEMEKAEASGQIPKGLARELRKLEKRDKKFEKELGKIRRAPELLTVKGGVLPVSSCLLTALILSGAAWYLSNGQVFSWIIPVIIWILGLAAIGYSIYGIYCCLRVIESVAITSEEAWIKKTVEAFKIAEKELEEEKKPELEFSFSGVQPPFHMEAESEIVIEFQMWIIGGDVARNTIVFFMAPQGFEFPDSTLGLPPRRYEELPNYISAQIELGDIPKGLYKERKVKLKAPSQPKEYNLFHVYLCEGYISGIDEFHVVVK